MIKSYSKLFVYCLFQGLVGAERVQPIEDVSRLSMLADVALQDQEDQDAIRPKKRRAEDPALSIYNFFKKHGDEFVDSKQSDELDKWLQEMVVASVAFAPILSTKKKLFEPKSAKKKLFEATCQLCKKSDTAPKEMTLEKRFRLHMLVNHCQLQLKCNGCSFKTNVLEELKNHGSLEHGGLFKLPYFAEGNFGPSFFRKFHFCPSSI